MQNHDGRYWWEGAAHLWQARAMAVEDRLLHSSLAFWLPLWRRHRRPLLFFQECMPLPQLPTSMDRNSVANVMTGMVNTVSRMAIHTCTEGARAGCFLPLLPTPLDGRQHLHSIMCGARPAMQPTACPTPSGATPIRSHRL